MCSITIACLPSVLILYYLWCPFAFGCPQAVTQSEDSFALRLSLAKPWLGLRGEELSAKCGVEGCVFVHVNGFIGGNATGGGAMAMAAKSLEMAESMA